MDTSGEAASNQEVKTTPEILNSIGAAVKQSRESMNISIRELARRSGLSPTAIWKIEAGKMAPSVLVLYKIAHGLGKKFTELMDPVFAEDEIVHTMRGARKRGAGNRGRDIMERISASSQGWVIQAGEHILKKGARSAREQMAHRGEELAYCMEGQVEYVIDGKSYVLNPGDSLHFRSHLAHSWTNTHNGISRMLLIVAPPRRPRAD